MNALNKTPAAAVTIFGAKGDLTRRKLIPALFNLFTAKHLPASFAIFCVDYLSLDENTFKDDLHSGVDEFSRNGVADKAVWAAFSANIFYIQGDFTKTDLFQTLQKKLTAFDAKQASPAIRLFYFAVAPRFIEVIADSLSTFKLCKKPGIHRMVIEKPFGTDLSSARKLNAVLRKKFEEKQIYRIDHYLGKETVQNIMAFRFANHVFEPLWNNRFIDYVQISVAEEVGVGQRGGYYETSGALRDMIQNHLLQMMCIVAMECPAAYKAEDVRDQKTKVLKSIRPLSPADVFKNVVRAQYGPGTIDGQPVKGYRQEDMVAPQSTTETFVAAKFFIDNKRWRGVPFFLGTGKCLPKQQTLIVIQFKDTPHKIFKDDIVSNRLEINIQPELKISLLFESKVPGLEMKLKAVDMDFAYQEAYTESLPEAYEALLLDALEGDATLFMRADQVDAAWKVVMPILDAWKKDPKKRLRFYAAGTWGPDDAKKLIRPFAKEWFYKR